MPKSVPPARPPFARPFAAMPLVGAAAAGLLLLSCQREPAPEEAPTTSGTSEPAATPTTPSIPVREPGLDRQGLLAAVAGAASAYAAGAARPETDPLVGQAFDVTLAFGCDGPAPAPAEGAGEGAGDGLARWSWGPERETIRLGLTPGDWTGSALIAGAGSDEWEAVEGFWIARPWMSSQDCPSLRADPLASGPVGPSPQTVGLAAVFEKGGSRLGRRNGRAYAHAVRAEGDAVLAPPQGGYRVRLQGRVVAFPDGRAIRCRAASPDQRPVCVAAIQLDRVAFQTATGEMLSEWRPG